MTETYVINSRAKADRNQLCSLCDFFKLGNCQFWPQEADPREPYGNMRCVLEVVNKGTLMHILAFTPKKD